MEFQTLMIFHGAINLACCISLIVLALQFRAQPGTRQWALCGIYQFLGLVLITCYSLSGLLLLAFGGSVFTLLSYIKYVDATRVAAERPPYSTNTQIALLLAIVLLHAPLALWAHNLSPQPQPMSWDNEYDWLTSLIDSSVATLATLAIVQVFIQTRVWRQPHWLLYSVTVILMGLLAASHLLLYLVTDANDYDFVLLVEKIYPLLSASLLVGITMGAILIVAGKLQQETHLRATRDPLTGLYNRLGFEEAFKKQASWAIRNKASISLVLCDIDHFKRINDTHGHQAGDAVIKDLAAMLEKNARGSDIVARFGGEEYLISLYDDCNAKAGRSYAERLRRLIADNGKGAGLDYTVSFGLAVHSDTINFDALFKAADTALYQSKRDGRNRISLAD